MTRDEAGRHLRSLMEAMYEGRSVRTPSEFRDDLRALRVAADVLDPQPGSDPEPTPAPAPTPAPVDDGGALVAP